MTQAQWQQLKGLCLLRRVVGGLFNRVEAADSDAGSDGGAAAADNDRPSYWQPAKNVLGGSDPEHPHKVCEMVAAELPCFTSKCQPAK